MRGDAGSAVASESQGPLRLALIGCGAITTLQHLPALRRIDSAEVVAVVDQDLERARATARQFGVPHAAARLADVEPTLDAVLVATPNHLHAPIALEALRRGLDVLVEKPMALDLAEAQAMVAEARARGRVLAVGLEFRFAPGNQAIRDLLAAGTLGRLERFELRQGVIPRWPFASDYVLRRETAGGGVLFDYGAHLLDLLFYWLGEPSSVRYRDDARGGLESNAEVELDGRLVGLSPLPRIQLASGPHTVRISKKGFITFARDGTVDARNPVSLDASMIPSTEFIADYDRVANGVRTGAYLAGGAGIAMVALGTGLRV